MATSNDFNYPLYNYAVGWFGRRPVNPLTHIAPIVKTDGRIGTYKRYNQGDVFRRVNTARAKYQEANSINISAEDPAYVLRDHSLKIGVDDTELKPGAGSRSEAANQIGQAKMGSLLTTWETSFIADGFEFFRSQVAAEAGKGAWSGAASSPVTELKQLIKDFRTTNGLAPNRILMSYDAWNIMAANAEMLDRVAYNSAKALTVPLLKDILELSGDDMGEDVSIMRAIVPIGTSQPGPGVPFVGANLLGADVWITYAQEGLAIDDLSGLKTFSDGGDSIVSGVESYYVRANKTTWHEVAMYRDWQVTAPTCVKRLSIS